MPIGAQAQVVGTAIEVFGTAGVVGGVTPIEVNGSDHTLLHSGIGGDLGVQGEHLSGDFGLKYWQLRPDHDVSGDGFDVALDAELRRGRDARTVLRLSGGASFGTFDTSLDGTTVYAWTGSVGVGHEIPLPNQSNLHLTLDVVVPSSEGRMHRSGPLLELGVGLRWRRLHEIRALSGGQR
jgi:hypothetical protein